MKLGMLGYAPFRCCFLACLIASLRKDDCNNGLPRLQPGGASEDAGPVPSSNRFSPHFCLLPYNKLSHFHPSTVSATLFNMPHRTYSSPPSQGHKRSFNRISTQNLSTTSPCRPESQRKHALNPLRPFDAFTTSQDLTSKLKNEYSSKSRRTSRLPTREETTLKKI